MIDAADGTAKKSKSKMMRKQIAQNAQAAMEEHIAVNVRDSGEVKVIPQSRGRTKNVKLVYPKNNQHQVSETIMVATRSMIR